MSDAESRVIDLRENQPWLLVPKAVFDVLSELFQALGITSVEALGAEISLRPASVEARFFLPVAGKKEGLLKLFDGQNSALAPPRFIPPDADSAAVMSLDLNAFREEIRRLMDRVDPGTTEGVDAFLEGIKEQMEKYLGIGTSVLVNEDDGVSYTTAIRLKPQK